MAKINFDNCKSVVCVGDDCSACGACSVVCPTQSIQFLYSTELGNYQISIDEQLCVKCGKCLSVCPVKVNDVGKYNGRLGDVLSVHSSYCKDVEIRKHAASGGFITGFLCSLMEAGIIDGVLLAKRTMVRGQSYIAKTVDEIIASKGSIYAPVDYSQGLKELFFTDCKKIAVVGLPCQIQAVSNMESMSQKIASKIVLKISLVCGKTPSVYAYKYIAKVSDFDYNDIQSVKNRGNGWPGFLEIKYKNGRFQVPYGDKLSMGGVLSSPFLCRRGCLSCMDGVGLSADIAVCDAWLPQYKSQSPEGWNLVLVKTGRANLYLKNENVNKWLLLQSETIPNFIKANRRVIEKATVGNNLRLKANKVWPKERCKSIKNVLYVSLLKIFGPLVKPKNFSFVQLYLGKIINKLKD